MSKVHKNAIRVFFVLVFLVVFQVLPLDYQIKLELCESLTRFRQMKTNCFLFFLFAAVLFFLLAVGMDARA